MKIKILTVLIIVVWTATCGNEDHNKAEEIIARFQAENVPDPREVVFNVTVVNDNETLLISGETSDEQLKPGWIKALHGLRFEDKITLLPETSVGSKKFALVNVPVANMRANPNHSAELITQAILGTPVKILKKENGWFYIQTPDQYISWVDEAALVCFSTDELDAWRHSFRMICTSVNGQVFKTENMQDQVSNVMMGCILQKLEVNNNQTKVVFPDGRTGYVPSNEWADFENFKNTVKPTGKSITDRAKQLTGRAYLWGGTSSNAMDCSGFVQTVWFIHGMILARDASLQTRHGEPVFPGSKYENLQPGDLLFFGHITGDSSTEKITHVAISLGGTEFIHESGMVKQNSFDTESEIYTEYRKNSFLRAQRLIGANNNNLQTVKEHPWF